VLDGFFEVIIDALGGKVLDESVGPYKAKILTSINEKK
tara:strand:- start:32 stop:145 length:114 start_codon:yes stop_codon:yes gene_type:complete